MFARNPENMLFGMEKYAKEQSSPRKLVAFQGDPIKGFAARRDESGEIERTYFDLSGQTPYFLTIVGSIKFRETAQNHTSTLWEVAKNGEPGAYIRIHMGRVIQMGKNGFSLWIDSLPSGQVSGFSLSFMDKNHSHFIAGKNRFGDVSHQSILRTLGEGFELQQQFPSASCNAAHNPETKALQINVQQVGVDGQLVENQIIFPATIPFWEIVRVIPDFSLLPSYAFESPQSEDAPWLEANLERLARIEWE